MEGRLEGGTGSLCLQGPSGAMLLLVCCFCYVVVAKFLLLSCCCYVVVVMLLLLCCCYIVVAILLLLFCCYYISVIIVLLLSCCCYSCFGCSFHDDNVVSVAIFRCRF